MNIADQKFFSRVACLPKLYIASKIYWSFLDLIKTGFANCVCGDGSGYAVRASRRIFFLSRCHNKQLFADLWVQFARLCSHIIQFCRSIDSELKKTISQSKISNQAGWSLRITQSILSFVYNLSVSCHLKLIPKLLSKTRGHRVYSN